MPMGFGSYAGKVVATVVVATDGTGDYTTIQEGIDALPAGGGVVYVKEGTYTITAAIEIRKSNVAVMGAGRTTLITLADNSDDHCIELGDGSTSFTGIVVADVRVDGNKDNNTGTLYGIYIMAQATDCKVQRCWVEDCNASNVAVGLNSDRNLVSECTSTGSGVDGILVAGSTRGNIISNNVCYSNTRNGIGTWVGSNVIEGNICYSNGPDASNLGSGIHLEAGGNLVVGNHCYDNHYAEITIWSGNEYNTVTGNFCTAGRGNGISVFGDHHTVSGNLVKLMDYRGIYLGGAAYCTVSANLVLNNNQKAAGTYDGIEVATTSTYNTVMGNVCSDDQGTATQKWGIKELATADNNNVYIGNICEGNVTGRILKKGAASVQAPPLCPIGTVLAWDKTLTNTPALPDGWVECNGQTISDAESPYDGVTIRDLNGDNRFLRGNSTSGGTGGSTSTDAFTGTKAPAGTAQCPYSPHAHTGNEPPYCNMVWILRIK